MGAILISSLDPRHFDERDIQSLSFVANQATVAIRNAQLVQRLNQLTEELEQRVAQRTEELARTLQDLTEERDRVGTLYQIARELSASFDLDRVLNEALNLVNRAIGISQGAILLFDRESEYLVYKAAIGRNVPLPRGGMRTPYKIGYGLAGKVIESREPRLVPDLHTDPFWVASEDAEQEVSHERRSAIAVPLSTGDDVLGVLLLFHPDPNYFNDDHLKLVTAASAQIATAVNNAELYRLITDQANRLGVLYRQQASEAAKNQAILEGITEGVLVLDATRSVVLVNPKAGEILNIKPDEVEQAPLRQILGRSGSPVELELTQLLYNHLLQALTQLEAGEQSVQFRIEAGPKVVMVSVAPVSLGSEEHPSIVAVLRDISREAEIERLKNEFISTVSHELRTPMTLIKGYTDLLLSGNEQIGQLNLTQNKFVRVMQSNANRLTDLVNDILEISRIETGRIKLKFAALDIRDVILDVATSFEREMRNKELKLSTRLPDQMPKIYADKSRLTQILVNLIGNAWQYTPEGGEIEVSANQTGRFVQVNVKDTGIGIPEKDIPYLFDRFFRSERSEVQIVDGTGLGLSITKSFVEMLGGRIWVTSELDVGTTFSFTIPLKGIDSGVSTERPAVLEPTRLLIVSNDHEEFNLIRPALEESGLEVIVAQDIETALLQISDIDHTLKAMVLDAKQTELPQLFRQITTKFPNSQTPILLSSFFVADSGNEIELQVVASISPAAEDQVILKSIEHVLGRPSDLRKTKELVTDTRIARILIAEANQNIAGWLRETLVVAGYEVQRAFNSGQAIDMIVGNRPDLILLSTAMPAGAEPPVLAQLRQDEDISHIPVVLIMDRLETATSVAPMIWGSRHWSRDHTSLSVQELIDELDQLVSNLEAEA
jgi:signal transduction histidine kinase/DNA-binding response OmpR family regulator